MELPISVMVVLFVAVVVGVGIIGFANHTLGSGKDSVDGLARLLDDDNIQDRIIEVGFEISAQVIEHLSAQCVRDSLRNAVQVREVCYVIHSTQGNNRVQIQNLDEFEHRGTTWTYHVSISSSDSRTLYIEFSPSDGEVRITD